MTQPTDHLLDEPALDLSQRENYEQERRSVVQPTPAEDAAALTPDAVEPPATPRCGSTGREVLHQPWSSDESSRWRRAPR
jgi:hypothetical protein